MPQLVHQRYGADLRNKTLASIKSEISSAMSSLLEELSSIEESRVLRAGSGGRSSQHTRSFPSRDRSRNQPTRNQQSRKSCTLCKTAGRPHNSHWLTGCPFLPAGDRDAMSRATICEDEDDGESDGDGEERCARATGEFDPYLDDVPQSQSRRVKNMASPILDVLHNSSTMHITIDSGSTANMIREDTARKHGITIYPSTQKAGQADGISKLDTVGEAHFMVQRDNDTLCFDGLVVKTLGDDILGGIPFMHDNDIGVRPFKSHIILGGSKIIKYDTRGVCEPMVRRTNPSFVLRAPPHQTILLPGESLSLKTPPEAVPNSSWALEPRSDISSRDI